MSAEHRAAWCRLHGIANGHSFVVSAKDSDPDSTTSVVTVFRAVAHTLVRPPAPASESAAAIAGAVPSLQRLADPESHNGRGDDEQSFEPLAQTEPSVEHADDDALLLP